MNSAEAEACFGDGNYVEAARLLGKVTAAVPAFEEVVLRFVEVNSPQALQAFLQTKMDSLGHEDKAQVGCLVLTLLRHLFQVDCLLAFACLLALHTCLLACLLACVLNRLLARLLACLLALLLFTVAAVQQSSYQSLT